MKVCKYHCFWENRLHKDLLHFPTFCPLLVGVWVNNGLSLIQASYFRQWLHYFFNLYSIKICSRQLLFFERKKGFKREVQAVQTGGLTKTHRALVLTRFCGRCALQSDRLRLQPNWLARSITSACWRSDGDECLFLFVKSPALLQHARQNEKQIKEAGNQHRKDVWLLAIELSALFTPNETTFSTAAY